MSPLWFTPSSFAKTSSVILQLAPLIYSYLVLSISTAVTVNVQNLKLFKVTLLLRPLSPYIWFPLNTQGHELQGLPSTPWSGLWLSQTSSCATLPLARCVPAILASVLFLKQLRHAWAYATSLPSAWSPLPPATVIKMASSHILIFSYPKYHLRKTSLTTSSKVASFPHFHYSCLKLAIFSAFP